LVWIAERGEAVIDVENWKCLEGRYALVTLIFIMRPMVTTGSEISGSYRQSMHAIWKAVNSDPSQGPFDTTEMERFPIGVFCNSDDEVISLNLGKSLNNSLAF
jgi:hypothetical protein